MRNILITVAALALTLTASAAPAMADDCNTSGAIAYSPSTGRLGWSYGQPSVWRATREANFACGVADCRWLQWETGKYAAVAVGSWGASTAASNDLPRAEWKAMAECRARGTGCHIERWIYN
jgi:hypothetical protein